MPNAKQTLPTDRAPSALARLVGTRRARILEALRTAKTTAEAAAAADIAMSTASEHLHELARAQVVERFRSGRSVYYALTPTGEALVEELSSRSAEHR